MLLTTEQNNKYNNDSHSNTTIQWNIDSSDIKYHTPPPTKKQFSTLLKGRIKATTKIVASILSLNNCFLVEAFPLKGTPCK